MKLFTALKMSIISITSWAIQKNTRDSGLSFDEYVWLKYKKDNSDKLEVCLQAQIIEYLIKYSSAFMKKYGDQYEGWLGNCNEQMQNDDDCSECIMHPIQHENYFLHFKAYAKTILKAA